MQCYCTGKAKGDEDLGTGKGESGIGNALLFTGRYSAHRCIRAYLNASAPHSADVVKMSEPIYQYDLVSPRKDQKLGMDLRNSNRKPQADIPFWTSNSHHQHTQPRLPQHHRHSNYR